MEWRGSASVGNQQKQTQKRLVPKKDERQYYDKVINIVKGKFEIKYGVRGGKRVQFARKIKLQAFGENI